MKNKIILIMVFSMMFYGNIFAQEKYGYIKPTFSFGLGSYDIIGEKIILNTMSVDIDFVSNFGFTLGIKNIIATNWENFEYSLYLPSIGIGYTYDDKRKYLDRGDRGASVGFKLVSLSYMNKPALGININAVEWLSANAGISALFDAYFIKDTNYALLLFGIGFTMEF